MSKIESYGVYQNNYYSGAVNGKNARKTDNADKTDNTDKTGRADKKDEVQLSQAAKKLLEELRKTYGNMDFIVADYESDEEAAEYLSRGTKEYSVLIDSETLEAMAADEETKDKYIGILEDSVSKLQDIGEELGDNKDEVARLGISIDKDGQVSYFAELEKIGEKQKEWVEKNIADKKAAKKEEEEKTQTEREKKVKGDLDAQSMVKRTFVSASSAEELLEKINAVDWEQISAEGKAWTGGRLDLSV